MRICWANLNKQKQNNNNNKNKPKAETQILWHLMKRADSFEKTLMLGKIEVGEGGDRG